MLDRSRLLILTILIAALLAAGFAVWFRYQASRRTLSLWGSDAARLIRNASVVEAWRVAPTDDPNAAEQQKAPTGEAVVITARRELQTVPDLAHIRRALLTDVHFLWDESAADCTPHWTHALRFQEGSEHATLWIDDGCNVVWLEETGAQAKMNPPLLRSIREKFLGHYLGPAAAP